MKNLLVVVFGVSLSVLYLQSANAWPSLRELEDVKGGSDSSESEQSEESEEMYVVESVGLEGGAHDGKSEFPEIQPRVTCDVMSGWAWGERLCALHCIAKGFRGGWCDSRKVCNCRR